MKTAQQPQQCDKYGDDRGNVENDPYFLLTFILVLQDLGDKPVIKRAPAPNELHFSSIKSMASFSSLLSNLTVII